MYVASERGTEDLDDLDLEDADSLGSHAEPRGATPGVKSSAGRAGTG